MSHSLHAPSVVLDDQFQQNLQMLLSYLLPLPLYGLFAAFLWFKAGWLGRKIAPGASADVAPASSGAHQSQRLILTMIGATVLAFAIPELARAIAEALVMASSPTEQAMPTSQLVGQNWALLLKFLIGFGLIFGAPTLSRSLDKINGTERKEAEDGTEQ